MLKEHWHCDACGDELPARPVLFLAYVEAPPDGKGCTQVNTDLCQPCMDRAVEAIDPERRIRSKLARDLKREPTFKVHGKNG